VEISRGRRLPTVKNMPYENKIRTQLLSAMQQDTKRRKGKRPKGCDFSSRENTSQKRNLLVQYTYDKFNRKLKTTVEQLERKIRKSKQGSLCSLVTTNF
jgi:hypothetical protein